ncbi:MAG: rane protein [Glaciihabitans sp.]|nr:rane protein [Glaciihabitans sp.]
MTIYRERLLPGPWVFISTALVIPASLLVFLPINVFVGVVVSIVMYALCVVVLIATSPVLLVTEDGFTAGRATVPINNVGVATGHERKEATLERGQKLDARAWLVIRGWVDPVVKVEILDEQDPAPYWLVSTRQPAVVIKALAEAHSRA